MADIKGPEWSGQERLGRNKQQTDEWSLKQQAAAAVARSRKSTKEGPLKPSIGNGTAEQKETRSISV